MATFYSPEGRRNLYKTAYVPCWAHKVQLKVSTFNWIVVLEIRKSKHSLYFRHKTTVIPLYRNDGYSLGTDPNFNTNAPPFEVRGCKVILGGAFLSQGDAN